MAQTMQDIILRRIEQEVNQRKLRLVLDFSYGNIGTLYIQGFDPRTTQTFVRAKFNFQSVWSHVELKFEVAPNNTGALPCAVPLSPTEARFQYANDKDVQALIDYIAKCCDVVKSTSKKK